MSTYIKTGFWENLKTTAPKNWLNLTKLINDIVDSNYKPSILGSLKITDTAPTAQGLYILSDVGTYTNLGDLVTTAGKINYAYFNGTTWSKVEVAVQNGKSAYELAVANGFVGTEAQWLASLKPAVLQTMGTSTTDAMSQKAVTDKLATLYSLAGTNGALNTTYTLGFITSNGVVNNHTMFEYTDYILIVGQDTVTISGHSFNSNTYLCFYDKNKTFIAGSAYAGSAANATLNVPAGAYYLRGTVSVGQSRLSVILNKNVDKVAFLYQEKLSVTSEQVEDSVRISNSIEETLDLNYIGQNLMSELSLITNFYINYSGDKVAHEFTNHCISPTIRLNNVKKIKYKGHLSNNTAIGFYSSDVISSANLVGIIKSSDQVDDYTIDINVPEGAKYIVASSSTATIPTLQLEIVELYPVTPYNEIDEQVSVNTSDIAILKGYGMDRVPYFTREFCRHIFNSAICIGDSITQGWRTTGVFLNESYPAYLAKITGWTVMNAGQGGQTPIGWMANQFALHDYTNYDVAVICLGQNQGLTDTIDADTASGDYNTYANTNTGQYCRIIEAIRAVNPEIKMMLLSRMNNGVGTTWNVVYKIGLKYDIPVVSFVTNGIDDLTKAVYHPYNDPIHFGTIGNLAIANVVSKSIEKYVYDNMNEFITYKE